MINLYDSKEQSFVNNGLVVLGDCISCSITEALNGQYELELEYPFDERGKWKYLLEGNIIKADGQLFRIYYKSKNMSSIRVNARHIFYDLLDNFLEDVRPTGKTGLGALQYILENTQYSHNFSCNGDVSGSNTKYFVRQNVVNAIMGTNSILSNWGGELVRDNFNIGLWQHRGNDNGVLIMGGKNLIGIEESLDIDNVCTRLLPLGKDGLMLPEKYIDSQYINNFPHPKINTKDFSDIDDIATLRATATQYMIDKAIDIPLVNYKVDFIELSKTEEYKDYKLLQTVENGDIVTIRYKKLNIDIKATVIKTNKKYVNDIWINGKAELGNYKGNIANVLNNIGSTLANITTSDGNVKGSKVQGIIDATKASLRAMADSAETQVEKAILFEDKIVGSPTYGAMAMGTKGFEIASVMTNNEWQWSTFGTGQGFIADMIIAGKILGNNAEFNLDEGFLKVTHSDGSYTKVDSSGMKRYVGGTGEEYHYLMTTGEKTTTTSGPAGTSTIIIDVPSEFQGKKYKCHASLAGFESMDTHITASTIKIWGVYELYDTNQVSINVGSMGLGEGFTQMQSAPFQIYVTYLLIA